LALFILYLTNILKGANRQKDSGMILQDSHGDKTTPSKTDFGLWNQVAAFGDTERILWFWGWGQKMRQFLITS